MFQGHHDSVLRCRHSRLDLDHAIAMTVHGCGQIKVPILAGCSVCRGETSLHRGGGFKREKVMASGYVK